jgi:hypothetical protein
LAHRTLSGAHRTLSGAHRTVRCPNVTVGSATRHARNPRPTVAPADRWLTGQSGASPDTPVNYSRMPLMAFRDRRLRLWTAHRTVRWFIPYTAVEVPRAASSSEPAWCTTGQSGAPRLRRLWLNKAISFLIRFFLFPALRHNTLVHKTMY